MSREAERDRDAVVRPVFRLLAQGGAVAGLTVAGWLCMSGTASAEEVTPLTAVQSATAVVEKTVTEAPASVASTTTQATAPVKAAATTTTPPPTTVRTPVRETAAKAPAEATRTTTTVREVVTRTVKKAETTTTSVTKSAERVVTASVSSATDVTAPATAAVESTLSAGSGVLAGGLGTTEVVSAVTGVVGTAVAATEPVVNRVVATPLAGAETVVNDAVAAVNARVTGVVQPVPATLTNPGVPLMSVDAVAPVAALRPPAARDRMALARPSSLGVQTASAALAARAPLDLPGSSLFGAAAATYAHPPGAMAPGLRGLHSPALPSPAPGSPLAPMVAASAAAALAGSGQLGGSAGLLGFLLIFGLSATALLRAASQRVVRPDGVKPLVSPA